MLQFLHGLWCSFKLESLQNFQQTDLDLQHGQPNADTLTGTDSKRQKCELISLLFCLWGEIIGVEFPGIVPQFWVPMQGVYGNVDVTALGKSDALIDGILCALSKKSVTWATDT